MSEYKEYKVKVYSNRTIWYNLQDRAHREDGPAVEYADGSKNWYIHGEKLTEQEFNNRNKVSYSGKVVEIDGKKYKLTEIS